jgi:hypothetical protein
VSDDKTVGESCEDCDRTYADTLWHAADVLWTRLVDPEGYGRGLLCPSCFGARARVAGVRIIFCALPESIAVPTAGWNPAIFGENP